MILKRLTTAVLALSMLFILNGCGLMPLPDEYRYSQINQIKDDLNLSSIGEMSSERYDSGDGVSSASFLEVELQGNKVFEKLAKRVTNLPNSKCDTAAIAQIRCRVSYLSVDLVKANNSSYEAAIVRITDDFSGRKPSWVD